MWPMSKNNNKSVARECAIKESHTQIKQGFKYKFLVNYRDGKGF